jgi:hypothetical protein
LIAPDVVVRYIKDGLQHLQDVGFVFIVHDNDGMRTGVDVGQAIMDEMKALLFEVQSSL